MKKINYGDTSRFHADHVNYNSLVESIANSTFNLDLIQRAVASGLQERLIKAYFSECDSVKEVREMDNVVGWLKGEKRKTNGKNIEPLPSICNHTNFYSIIDKGIEKRIVLTHPYIQDLDFENDVNDLVHWCNANEIRFMLSHNSWHFFGRTLLVQLRAKQK